MVLFNLAWFRPRRKPDPVATTAEVVELETLMAGWTRKARAGGPGSDIAAAKIQGARTMMFYLAPALQTTAKGWRGQAVRR